MSLTGKLRTWHDDRGFGFIAPTGGGPELFVHISAFPNDGSRPTEGESVTYELGRGKDGKPAAVRVFRQALGDPSTYPAKRRTAAGPGRSLLGSVILLVLFGALGAYAFTHFKDSHHRRQLAKLPPTPESMPPAPASPRPLAAMPSAAAPFRCDGRIHCTQMNSCAEAKFFINNCPGTKMDGDGDGIPCEDQWCTNPLAK